MTDKIISLEWLRKSDMMDVLLPHRLDDLAKRFRSVANGRTSPIARERQRWQAILDAAAEGMAFANREVVRMYPHLYP